MKMPTIPFADTFKNFLPLKKYFIQSWAELMKVNWPKKEELIRLTILVLISAGLAMLIIAGVDWVLSKLVNIWLTK